MHITFNPIINNNRYKTPSFAAKKPVNLSNSVFGNVENLKAQAELAREIYLEEFSFPQSGNRFYSKGNFEYFFTFFVDLKNRILDNSLIKKFSRIYIHGLRSVSERDKLLAIHRTLDWYEKLNSNLEKYVGIDSEITPEQFFTYALVPLTKAMCVYDDKTIEALFSRKLNNVLYYLDGFNVDGELLSLLKDLVNSKNVDGNDLSINEKLNLAHVVSTFPEAEMEYLDEMAMEGVVDLKKIKEKYFSKLFSMLHFNDLEIQDALKENLINWDVNELSMILQAIRSNNWAFTDLFLAISSQNFNKYIHSEINEIGKSNLITKSVFEERRMNYEKWVKPSKEHEVKFFAIDKNAEKIEQISQELIENIDALRSSQLKGFFDRRYSQFLQGDEFVLPETIKKSKENLKHFIKNIITQLEPAWRRAEKNLETKNSEIARNTLTLRSHFEQILDDLSKVTNNKIEQTLDFTIKMWDRYPQKDLFQGNYSSCCVAMNKANGHVMPNYLLNTSLNMIEIVDNKTGKIIGNALCYFAKDDLDKNMFIIDNIEINNAYKPSSELSEKLVFAIKEYVRKICNDITENEDIPIYLGTKYNDLSMNAALVTKNIEFLGELNCSDIYLDVYGGWRDTDKMCKAVKLFDLSYKEI